MPPIGVSLEYHLDLVPHLPEYRELFFVRACRVRRVKKAPMMPVQLAGIGRTRLVSVATDRDDRLHRLVEEIIMCLE